MELIRGAGAAPARVLIALDRQERGQGALSAVQEVERDYGIPVVSVAALADLIAFLAGNPELERNLDAVNAYRLQYGIRDNDMILRLLLLTLGLAPALPAAAKTFCCTDPSGRQVCGDPLPRSATTGVTGMSDQGAGTQDRGTALGRPSSGSSGRVNCA